MSNSARRLARYGLTVGDVNQLTEAIAVGHHVGDVLEGEQRFGIVVKTAHDYAGDLSVLEGLPLKHSAVRRFDDWRSGLNAATCDAPCAGGLAGVSKQVQCTSGLSCIPGTGGERFAEVEPWTLYLSAVQELDSAGRPTDPCPMRKDFWVCRTGTTACASQMDACDNAGKAQVAIPVTGAELDHLGVSLEVPQDRSWR